MSGTFVIPVMEPEYINQSIPRDICSQILSYLPVKSLLRFRSVSKDWKSIIDDSGFTFLHLNRYANNSLDSHLITLESKPGMARARLFSYCNTMKSCQETLEFNSPVPENLRFYDFGWPKIVGDVDGLLLVQRRPYSWNRGDVYLWNPSIGRRINIPSSRWFSRTDILSMKGLNLFLGFDPSSNDYKVVAIINDSPSTVDYDIFSLNSSSWRKGYSCGNEGKPLRLRDRDLCVKKLSFGGLVHWVAEGVFISFDMASERFSYIRVPNVPSESRFLLPIVVAGSSVGLVASFDGAANIWVLERDGFWSERFNLNTNVEGLYSCSTYLSKDGVLIGKYEMSTISAYDVKSGNKNVVSECDEWMTFYIGQYVESLVLLNHKQPMSAHCRFRDASRG